MTSLAAMRLTPHTGAEHLHPHVGGAVGDLELRGGADRVALLREEGRELRLGRVRHVPCEADQVALVGVEVLGPVGPDVGCAGAEDEDGGCEQPGPAE